MFLMTKFRSLWIKPVLFMKLSSAFLQKVKKMSILAIDLETFCDLDIKKVGTYKYAENCEIMLCAYAYDDAKVQIIDLACGEKFPADFEAALFNPNVIKTAYNAPFEMQVLEKYFGRSIDPAQWDCSMVLGLRMGLPAGLDELGRVLRIVADKRKLASGQRLIKYFSIPRTVSPAATLNLWGNENDTRNLPEHNRQKWNEFREYCKQDVESERAIRHQLERFTPTDFERKLWCLDQKINSNGVLIDMDLVEGAIKINDQLQAIAVEQNRALTGGINLNSNTQLLNWFEEQEGWRPSSLDQASRADLKSDKLKANVRKVLELKEILAKTSIKKYEAMQATACEDRRARGMFQFYGANRTGRWSGRLIQLQNLPQIHLDTLDIARQFVKNADTDALLIFYDNPADILSQVIRTAFVAEEGSRFIVADFSAIEARVIAWLADEKWRLKVFAAGGDIYCASASAMFKVPVEKHGVNKELRAKGKIAELACGYSGGVSALKAFGVDKMGLTEAEMDSIIKKWRASSPNICKLWNDVENAAKRAVKTKATITLNLKQKIEFQVDGDFLLVTLPSGRKISYYKPKIVAEDKKESLTYEGTLQASTGWGINRTWGGKLVENIVQAIARDCLAIAMTRLDDAGYKIVMHIHDEIVCEMPNGKGSLAEVVDIMSQTIDWAKGLVLNAAGYETKYYRKD